jgi:hypothetical protein
MENYVSWLQNAMSTFPWVNTDQSKKLVNHATENVTATFSFLQKAVSPSTERLGAIDGVSHEKWDRDGWQSLS